MKASLKLSPQKWSVSKDIQIFADHDSVWTVKLLFSGVFFRGKSNECHRIDDQAKLIMSQHDNST